LSWKSNRECYYSNWQFFSAVSDLSLQTQGLKLDLDWFACYVNNSSLFVIGHPPEGFYYLDEKERCLKLLPFDVSRMRETLGITSSRQMILPMVLHSCVQYVKWFFFVRYQRFYGIIRQKYSANGHDRQCFKAVDIIKLCG